MPNEGITSKREILNGWSGQPSRHECLPRLGSV